MTGINTQAKRTNSSKNRTEKDKETEFCADERLIAEV